MNGGPAGAIPWLASQPNNSGNPLSTAVEMVSMVTVAGMPA